MPLAKGQTNNYKGRPKGIPNRTTAEVRGMLEKILFGQIENIGEALETVRQADPPKYLEMCSKLFAFVLPKRTEIDLNAQAEINIQPKNWV